MKKYQLFKSLLIPCIIAGLSAVATAQSKSTSTITSLSSSWDFDHNFDSIEEKYQNEYYFDVNREEIIRYNTNEAIGKHYGKYGILKNRFNNVYYHDDTIVSIYHFDKNQHKDEYFVDKSINTSWKSQDGFAYIPDKDTKCQPVNSWLQVMAYNYQVAEYFSGGKDHVNDPCTGESIQEFVKREITKSDGIINLSGLYKYDRSRDNSVLALLNPTLNKYLLKPSHDNTNKYVIKGWNLSNNRLRSVPNWASIGNELDDNWFFETANYLPRGMTDGLNDLSWNTISSRKNGRTDAIYKTINLEHNRLTYVDLQAYSDYDNEHDPNPSEKAKKSGFKQTSNPGLLTLVKCRYNNISDLIFNPSHPKEGFNGLMLDYNFMPRIYWDADDSVNNTYLWWEKQLDSWFHYDLPLQFVNDDLSYARAFMTYTIANANNDVIWEIEYLLGMGLYQEDGVWLNNRDTVNYINKQFEGQQKNFDPAEDPAKYVDKDKETLFELMEKFMVINGAISTPCNVTFSVNGGTLSVLASSPTWCGYSSDRLHGTIFLLLHWPSYRIGNVPSTIDIGSGSNINELVQKLMKYISLHKITNVSLSAFKTSNTIVYVWVALSGWVFILLFGSGIYYFIKNVHHRQKLLKRVKTK